jgi:hypothetical protein
MSEWLVNNLIKYEIGEDEMSIVYRLLQDYIPVYRKTKIEHNADFYSPPLII